MDFLKINKVDHIGIAIKDLDALKDLFEKVFNLKPSSIEEVPSQKVRVVSFKIGDTNIELLEGTASDSAITKFIEKKGNGIHHICLEVDNLNESISALNRVGIKLIDKEPRDGAHGKKIAFLHPKATKGILTELTEKD